MTYRTLTLDGVAEMQHHLQSVGEHVNAIVGFGLFVVATCFDSKRSACFIVQTNSSLGPNSYAINPRVAHGYTIQGGAVEGATKGLWHLVRSLKVWRGQHSATLPVNMRVMHSSDAELWPLRGHQINFPSLFRTWGELSAYALDLAAFGTNELELSHVSASSSLPVRAISNFSRLTTSHGLGTSIWWQAALSSAHADQLPALFASMPKIDTMFFPGGDGGSLNISAIEITLAAARPHHPRMQIWISLQGLNSSLFGEACARLDSARWRRLVSGIVYGPHERYALDDFVKRVPPRYPIRQYPDIAHGAPRV